MTPKTAAERGTFRDTPSNGTTGLPAAAHAGVAGRLYVLGVLCAGCGVLVQSVWALWPMHLPLQFWALATVTLVSGSAVLKIPGVPVNFSISDVFTLTSAAVFGPAAGTVMVAFDSLVISARLSRTGLPLERLLFNAAAPPAAMWLSAQTFFHASGLRPLFAQSIGLEIVAPWLLAFAGLYFLLNTFAIAVAIALHQRDSVVAIWRAHFQSLWFTFIGGALGAAFVVFALQRGTYGMMVLSLPLLLAALLHFAYRNATGRVEDQLRHLADVNRLHLSTIEALARAIDAKDGVTHDHIRRVQRRAIELAARIGVDDPLQIRAIEGAALLHDVGKIAIPEHILNKPGALTPAEFERMKSHARIGADILSQVEFPYPVVPIVLHHHENWDGSGYPDGLKGEDIPIGARVLAVVDCFDALTSDRPYRRALSVPKTFEIITARSGTMYDPAIVSAFRQICDLTDVTRPDADGGPHAARPEPAGGTSGTAERPSASDETHVAVHFGAAVSRCLEDPCPWSALADALCELPDVTTAIIFVASETNEYLSPCRVSGRHAWRLKELVMPMGERMSGWVAASGQTMLNADAALDLFDVSATSLRCAMGVPGLGPDGRPAVVALYSTRPDAFAPVHRRLVEEALSLFAEKATVRTKIDGRHDDRQAPILPHRGLRAVSAGDRRAGVPHASGRTRRAG